MKRKNDRIERAVTHLINGWPADEVTHGLRDDELVALVDRLAEMLCWNVVADIGDRKRPLPKDLRVALLERAASTDPAAVARAVISMGSRGGK